MKKILFCILAIAASIDIFGQGSTCINADPFCTGTTVNFPAGVNAGYAEAGADYGCLYSQPNPAWYYMQVDTAGPIQVTMQSIPYQDIDFACWGPFNSYTTPCVALLTAGPVHPSHADPGPSPYYPSANMIDCSYSAYGIEYCYIPNGQPGEFYILLITNYSNQSCNITFNQSAGSGTTSCTILPYVQGDSVCVGQTIQLSVLIPTPGASYYWTGPNGWTDTTMNPIIPNADTSMAGVYTMVMTVGGQISPPVTCNVYVNMYPTVTISPVNPVACQGAPFLLTANSTGPGSTYYWSNGSTNNPVTLNLSAPGYYSVTATDMAGCSGVDSVYVDIAMSPHVNVSASPSPVCGGLATTLTATGADSYTWSHGLGTGNPVSTAPLVNSTYTVTGTASNGCTGTAAVFVQVVGPPVTVVATQNPICAGVSTTLVGFYGTSYSWSHGLGTGNNKIVTPSTTTTYTVTATDGGGCTASASYTVIVNPTLTVSVTITQSPPGTICTGTPVTFTATPVNGGTSPAYAWKLNGGNVGTNNPVYSNSSLNNGDVITCVLTSNATGCISGNPDTSNAITITVASSLPAGVNITASPPGAICQGQNVTFTATPTNGGVPSYQWMVSGSNEGGNSPNFSSDSLENGDIVTCVMTSSLSCATGNPATSNSMSMTVNIMPDASVNPSGPFCSNEPAATLSPVNPGGTWYGNGITDSLTGQFSPSVAGPGVHDISYVLVAGACSDTGHFIIPINQSYNAAIVPVGPFCSSDGAISLLSPAPGGTWSGPGIIDPNLEIFDPSVAGAGSHLITHIIGGPCPDTGYTTIQVFDNADATINPAGPYCANAGTVNLTAADPGGTWSGNGITNPLTGLFNPAVAGPGSHTITYIIGGNCGDSNSRIIVVNPMDNATINPGGPYCSDLPPVTLTAATPGGVWSGPGITDSLAGVFNPGIGLGSYLISYTTNGICPNTDTAIIVINNTADATINPAGPFCSGGSPVNLTAHTGGGLWSGTGITNPSTGTFNPAVAGTGSHVITYTLTGLCAATDTATLIVNQTPDASINPAGPFCNNSSPVNMTAVNPGGSWSGTGITNSALGTFNPTVAGPGTHTITYILVSGICADTQTTNIVVYPLANANINPAGPYCETDPALNLSPVTPGGLWSGTGITNNSTGTFDPSVAGPGTHTITYSVTGVCPNTGTTNITVYSLLSAAINPAGPFCISDLPVNLSPQNSGGTWSGPGITDSAAGTFDPTTAGLGVHTVTYILTNGACTDSGTLNITINSTADATINPAGPFCTGDTTVTLTAVTPGGNWTGNGITSGSAGTFNPALVGAGSHLIIYMIVNGQCSDTGYLVIDVITSADATIDPAGPFCSDALPYTLSATDSGGIWSGPGITDSIGGIFSPMLAGTGVHYIYYTISGLCGDTDTATIIVNTVADASISAAGPFCPENPPVVLNAADTGGIWSGDGISNASAGTFNAGIAGPGIHSIIYEISGACGDTDTLLITVHPAVSISAVVMAESCLGAGDGSVNLSVDSGMLPFAFSWDNGADSEDIELLAPGIYIVIVTDSNGCSDEGSYEVLASETLCYTPLVYIPNIFSPNGDGINDVFRVRGMGIKEMSLSVYDRWGEKIFESNNPEDGWDGTYQGKEMDNAAYIFYINIIMENGEEIFRYGSVTLTR